MDTPKVAQSFIEQKVCAPRECHDSYTCDKHAASRRARDASEAATRERDRLTARVYELATGFGVKPIEVPALVALTFADRELTAKDIARGQEIWREWVKND